LPEEKSIVVHVGLANAGARASLKKIAHYPASLWRDFPLSISVAKTNNKANASDEEAIEDYCKSLRLIEEKKCIGDGRNQYFVSKYVRWRAVYDAGAPRKPYERDRYDRPDAPGVCENAD
jgi:hypothetical protein